VFFGRIKSTSAILLVILISVAVIIPIVHFYINSEDPIYVWDYGNYWRQFRSFGSMISSGAPWLEEARISMRKDDYNPLAAIVLYPAYAIWGGDRSVYVQAIAVAYLVPAALLATALAVRVVGLETRAARITVFIAALFYVPFWTPTLRGMVDVVGLVPLGLATILIMRPEALTWRNIGRPILIGLTLWLAFVFRRWYAYSIVAVFCLYAIVQLAHALKVRASVRGYLLHAVAVCLAFSVFLALVLAFQWDVVHRAATTDYSILHSSYSSDMVTEIAKAIDRLGWLYTGLAVVGAVLSVAGMNALAIICIVAAAFTFSIFVRTQGMGIHHFLPVAFWIFPLIVFGMNAITKVFLLRWRQKRLIPFVVLAVFAFVYAIGPLPSLQAGGRLLPVRVPPLTLQNMPEYQRLVTDLHTLAGDDGKISVFASSMVMSSDLLSLLDPDLDRKLHLISPDAMRVPYTFEALRSTLAVVVVPSQSHLPGSQEHLIIPNEMIADQRGFGRAFVVAGGPYDLADGAVGYIYRRVRDLSVQEVRDHLRELLSIYPNWRNQPEIELSAALLARSVTPGDVYGYARYAGFNRLAVHPGPTTPTDVEVPVIDDAIPSTIVVSVHDGEGKNCPSADGVLASVAVDGIFQPAELVDKGTSTELHLVSKPAGSITIRVDSNQNPKCDYVALRFLP
jgi:hypothetical protein